MKRNGGIFTFLTIMFSSLASAGPVEGLERLADGANEMIMIIVQFLSDVVFNLESFDELFFAKILLFLLIFFVTYTVLRRNDTFGKDKKIAIIITSAISILAIRYLPTEFVEAILLQYSAFAVGITTLLPLMIFFFFLHQSGIGHRGRQMGWIIYGAALIAIVGMRYTDLGSASYIYYAAIIGIIISILGDKMIHEQFRESERKEGKKQRNLRLYMRLDKEYRELSENIEKSGITGTDKKRAEKTLRHMEERLKTLHKNIN